MKGKTTLGVIIGNRPLFADRLAKEGRGEILRLLREQGIEAVCLSPRESKFGCVETWEEAKRCGELFAARRDRIDGVLVSLPNFGDERAIADALRLSGLQAPVLIQAYPDEAKKMSVGERRDSFCGKLSVCNTKAWHTPGMISTSNRGAINRIFHSPPRRVFPDYQSCLLLTAILHCRLEGM